MPNFSSASFASEVLKGLGMDFGNLGVLINWIDWLSEIPSFSRNRKKLRKVESARAVDSRDGSDFLPLRFFRLLPFRQAR